MWSVPTILVLAALQCTLGSSAQPSQRDALPAYLQSRRSLLNVGVSDGSGIASVTLTDDKQSYYTVIQVGGINFRVALDTGSSDFWLMSSACSNKTCTTVPRYPLDYHSPSFISVNDNSTVFSIQFADGTAASGFVARESVQFSNLTLANQAFGVVTNSNVTMIDNVSGIIGLGFPRLSGISNSVVNATPFVATLAAQGNLNYPLFGLSLTRNSSGTLAIGAIDTTVVNNVSNIKWNEVTSFAPFGSESNASSYLQWAIHLSSFAVNGTVITPMPTYPNAAGNKSLALLDVGTSGLFGPYQDVSRLFSMIDGSRLVDFTGQWALPCDTPDTLSFTFGGQSYTLQPSDYLIGPTSGDPTYCLSWPKALPPSSDGIDWQLGSAFLRTVYSVFSYGINMKEPPMIGLYALSASNATVENPGVVSAFLSSESATLATTLPNLVLSTPTYTIPPYIFNTSVSAPPSGIVSSGLATSTYSPLLESSHPNVTALPTIAGLPTLITLVLTDAYGLIHTTTTTVAQPSVTLGEPPGWSAATSTPITLSTALFSCIISIVAFVFI